jgi:hypothetical protein
MIRHCAFFLTATLAGLSVLAGQTVPLDPANLKLVQVKAERVTFKGRPALRVTDAAPQSAGDEGRLAIVSGTSLLDGTIEIELAGETGSGASQTARGFVGMTFRTASDGKRFECFFLRPTNGRADDQVRRNHSAQYISVPGFPWHLLRKEFPEKYESYVDLVPAEWTKVRIEVKGSAARLYVHDAPQPALIVNDLKQSPAEGAVALWLGPGTVAHFADLRLTK